MKIKSLITVVLFAMLLGAFSVMCFFKAPGDFSESERRPLEKLPEVSIESILSGKFMQSFEKYATDQVPFREALKSIKAGFVFNVINKKDNNGIFIHEGHLSKLDGEINEEMLKYAVDRFLYIYESYLKDKNMSIYLSVIPDKNYFLASGGYPALDFDALVNKMQEKCPYMTYIDIAPLLSLDSYYKTDSHWKMEEIVPVGESLLAAMGNYSKAEYENLTLDKPFLGVYAMQSSLKFEGDVIKYLTNDTLEGATVTYYDTGVGVVGDMYNMDKAYGKDAYEMFLSGSTPVCTIENPNAKEEKELILFRDSFGSSIAPILLEGYSKITLVDIRYVQSQYIGNFVDFKEGSDVLFLYSTVLLNNSMAMR